MSISFLAKWRAAFLGAATLGLLMPRCGGDDFSEGSTPKNDAGADASTGGCPAGSKECAGNCVPFDDPAFGCSSPVCDPCPGLNGKAACSNGCQLLCDAGFEDCDKDPANGCETVTKFDPENCGSCDKKCTSGESCVDGGCINTGCPGEQVKCTVNGPCINLGTKENCAHCSDKCGRPNTQATCDSGKCKITSCSQGFADCNNDPKDGCETNLQNSGAHCGACDRKCELTNAVSTQCVAGVCAPSCKRSGGQYFADCTQPQAPTEDDGCETNITDPANCGGCGLACQTGLVCALKGGTPWPRCICTQDKQCTEKVSSVIPNTACNEAAGKCSCPSSESCAPGEICVALPKAVVCDCGGVKCLPGQHCCSDGCKDVETDPKNCGACGRTCAPGQACKGWTCISPD